MTLIANDWTDPVAHGGDPVPYAHELARQDYVVAEAIIDTLVAQSIEQWRLADATFWQRVRYRARLVRARTQLDAPDAARRKA